MSAAQAVALATQLEAHAKGHKLSSDAADALADLAAARRALEKVNVAKVTEPSASNPAAVEADRVIDRAWGAVAQLVAAWVQVDDKKLSPFAKEMQEALFANGGTAFLAAKYTEEWAESEARLKAIATKKLDGHFDKLGAGVFLSTLKRAHAAYGKALGVTEAKDPPAPAPKVKEALDGVTAAMREYVVKTSAMANHRKKGSEEMVDVLLLPLTQWESSRAAPVDAPVPAPPAPQPPT